jgi:hypothetical protein
MARVIGVLILAVGLGAACATETEVVTPSPGGCPPPEESDDSGAGILGRTPPAGWTAGLAWFNALHDGEDGGESYLEVDWVRLYATVNGRERLLAGDIGGNPTGIHWQGLWLRDPWFGNDDYHEPVSFPTRQGVAHLPLSQHGDRIWHFGSRRATLPSGTTSMYARARVRGRGAAKVQLGMDFWRDLNTPWCGWNECNTEAAHGEWFCPTEEWAVITAGEP